MTKQVKSALMLLAFAVGAYAAYVMAMKQKQKTDIVAEGKRRYGPNFDAYQDAGY